MATTTARLPLSQLSIAVILILRAASSSAASVPTATPTAAAPAGVSVSAAKHDAVEATTESAVRGARRSSGTRRPCQLMARDPRLGSRVRQMSADGGRTHLVKYSLLFPDGSQNVTTGPRHFTAYFYRA